MRQPLPLRFRALQQFANWIGTPILYDGPEGWPGEPQRPGFWIRTERFIEAAAAWCGSIAENWVVAAVATSAYVAATGVLYDQVSARWTAAHSSATEQGNVGGGPSATAGDGALMVALVLVALAGPFVAGLVARDSHSRAARLREADEHLRAMVQFGGPTAVLRHLDDAVRRARLLGERAQVHATIEPRLVPWAAAVGVSSDGAVVWLLAVRTALFMEFGDTMLGSPDKRWLMFGYRRNRPWNVAVYIADHAFNLIRPWPAELRLLWRGTSNQYAPRGRPLKGDYILAKQFRTTIESAHQDVQTRAAGPWAAIAVAPQGDASQTEFRDMDERAWWGPFGLKYVVAIGDCSADGAEMDAGPRALGVVVVSFDASEGAAERVSTDNATYEAAMQIATCVSDLLVKAPMEQLFNAMCADHTERDYRPGAEPPRPVSWATEFDERLKKVRPVPPAAVV